MKKDTIIIGGMIGVVLSGIMISIIFGMLGVNLPMPIDNNAYLELASSTTYSFDFFNNKTSAIIIGTIWLIIIIGYISFIAYKTSYLKYAWTVIINILQFLLHLQFLTQFIVISKK